MRKKNLFSLFLVLALMPATFGCKDDKGGDEPGVPKDIAKNIIGKWLLASSNAGNWISYEFTESSRINGEMTQNGIYESGTGWYSIDEAKAYISGSFTTERDRTYYLDWEVTNTRAFQIDFKLYDDNTYLGESSIYRVVTTQQVEVDASVTPNYRSICGTENLSDFQSLDPEVATVSRTGEITGGEIGTTFITFTTPNGRAAIEVEVVASAKPFAEQIIGAWVYDSEKEKTWERYEYEADGHLNVKWQTKDGELNLDESASTTYAVDGTTVSFVIPLGTVQMNMRMETESINDFNWTYTAYDGTHNNGKYTAQKILESLELEPGESQLPYYQSLTSGQEITGFASHNTSVATVNSSTGTIQAVGKGRTYIDVITPAGTGVVEVNVESETLPYAFEECLGKTANDVKKMLGEPYYEDATTMLYRDLEGDIKMAGVSLDPLSLLVKGIVVTFDSDVKAADVTDVLNATFIPFMSQTTDTFKAYMDAANRADATVGVTWDIPKLTLTYVNLATGLFPDYSVLLGLTRTQVVARMGKEPDLNNEDQQSYFFYDNKGVKIVSAYYTDFVDHFDKVQSVVTMFDDTLSEKEITEYLNKKYVYYPEYSTEEELVYIPAGHAMEIFYRPADKMIMYFPVKDAAQVAPRAKLAQKLANKTKSIKR